MPPGWAFWAGVTLAVVNGVTCMIVIASTGPGLEQTIAKGLLVGVQPLAFMLFAVEGCLEKQRIKRDKAMEQNLEG